MEPPVDFQYHRNEEGHICGPLGLLSLTSEPEGPLPLYPWMYDPEAERSGFIETTVRVHAGMTTTR